MIAILISFSFLLLNTGTLFAADLIEFDLMHTRPECAVEGKKTTYCERADRGRVAKLSGMEDSVAAMLAEAQDPTLAKITIAYFSFSNFSVFENLCKKGKEGFVIEGFFDKSYSVGDTMPLKLRNECQGPSGDNVKINFLGTQQNNTWRLHHNKFLMIDSGPQEKLRINFSSGNLSAFGLSNHFDHWVVMKTERNTQLAKQYLCVAEALKASLTGDPETPDNPSVYISSLEACQKKAKIHVDFSDYSKLTRWVESSIDREKIAPFFSPNLYNEIATALIAQIRMVKSGGRIYGCMQHFLHYRIASALKDAVSRGVKVDLLMDDDIVVGGSEVPGVKEFYDNVLQPAGIQIRFMQTNSLDKQMMHNKFLILEGLQTKKGIRNRVFSGAGHFTSAGMRNNYENFALTQEDSLTEKYQILFNYMSQNSMNEQEAKGEVESPVINTVGDQN